MIQEALTFLKTREKMNLLIVAANILVFAVLELAGNTADAGFMAQHGAMYVPYVTEYGEYYRLFTSMFLHFGLQHLCYNMLLILFMGDMLEKLTGKWRYLVICLGGGLCGNLLSMAVSMRAEHYAISAGASGAAFAIVGGLAVLVLRSRNRIRDLDGRRLAVMAALTLADGFTQSGTDNMAHLGGFLGGALLCFLVTLKRSRRQQ